MQKNRISLIKIKSMISSDFIFIMGGNILSKAISLLSSIIIIRIVDKLDYGNYSYALNIIGYFELFLGLGLPNALLKFCSSKDYKDYDSKIYKTTLRVGCIFEAVIGVIIVLISFIVDWPFERVSFYLIIMCGIPFLTNFFATNQMYLRAHLQNKKYAVNGFLQVAFLFLFCIFLIKPFGVVGMVISSYLALILICIISYFQIKKMVSGRVNSNLQGYASIRIKLFNMGISLMLINMFSSIIPLNESFLINNIIKSEIITANFRTANVFPSLLYLVSGAVVIYYFPLVSAKEKDADVLKYICRIAVINLLCITILTLLGIILTPWAMRFLFGSKYDDAIPISYLMWIMVAINCGIRMIPMNFLPALNVTKINLICISISSVIHFVLDYFLISKMGIRGVVYASITIYILSGLVFWWYLIKVCKERFSNVAY